MSADSEMRDTYIWTAKNLLDLSLTMDSRSLDNEMATLSQILRRLRLSVRDYSQSTFDPFDTE